MSKLSQTATEYLIILAVVIVIALIVVGVLGGIPGIGGSSSKKTNDLSLRSKPVAIEQYAVSNETTILTLRNNLPESIRITGLNLDTTACNVSNFILEQGQVKKIECNNIYELNTTFFEYDATISYAKILSGSRYTQGDMILQGDVAGAISTSGALSGGGSGESGGSGIPPVVSLSVVYPSGDIDATQNEFFNVTVNVSCSAADCGNVDVSLDPYASGVSADFGSNDGTLSTNSLVSNSASFTWSAWIYTNPHNAWGILASVKDGTNRIYFFVDSNYAISFNIMNLGSTSSLVSSNSVISTGVWYSVLMTYDGGSVVIYVNGSVVKTGVMSQSFPSGLTSTLMGTIFSSPAYNGYIAHPAEWDSVLSPAEIAELASGVAPDQIATTPTRYWDDLSGPGPHSPKIGTGDLTESGTVGDAASDPPVFAAATFSSKAGLVSTTPGATPFYTNGTNPTTISLNENESQLVTWYVNATGSTNNVYEFFAFANVTSNASISDITNKWNVTIT